MLQVSPEFNPLPETGACRQDEILPVNWGVLFRDGQIRTGSAGFPGRKTNYLGAVLGPDDKSSDVNINFDPDGVVVDNLGCFGQCGQLGGLAYGFDFVLTLSIPRSIRGGAGVNNRGVLTSSFSGCPVSCSTYWGDGIRFSQGSESLNSIPYNFGTGVYYDPYSGQEVETNNRAYDEFNCTGQLEDNEDSVCPQCPSKAIPAVTEEFGFDSADTDQHTISFGVNFSARGDCPC